ncbi:dephospho-CoA kinase [Parendozoicomonas haliclonae]|uniref:Dephospho-CoA kinase n=1 Tax=Parendozoicomonas haliclonae TaxID=1960125 RepID=A0A1X7AEN5_9GAMM|nr:dephospho-CoA kinase [Parendozoicomonas haliclonae]SMA34975.1 Dephospho-CoA kinase [Parendozoicomonas haliclonae]
MLTIGVTGGIGCGKSAVTDYLTQKGILIADADQAARKVVEPGQPALKAIAEHFGDHLIQADGNLDRRALRDIVFNDPEQRRWLEQLTHPLINQQLSDEIASATSPYVILVSPLLFEARQNQLVDRVLVIDTTEEMQISRAMARDNISREQASAILNAQASREQRLSMADDVVENSGSLDELYLQLDKLHETYLTLTRQQ